MIQSRQNYQLVHTLEGAKDRIEKVKCEEPKSNLGTRDCVEEENVFLNPFRL